MKKKKKEEEEEEAKVENLRSGLCHMQIVSKWTLLEISDQQTKQVRFATAFLDKAPALFPLQKLHLFAENTQRIDQKRRSFWSIEGFR